jgi:hypothetical protein
MLQVVYLQLEARADLCDGRITRLSAPEIRNDDEIDEARLLRAYGLLGGMHLGLYEGRRPTKMIVADSRRINVVPQCLARVEEDPVLAQAAAAPFPPSPNHIAPSLRRPRASQPKTAKHHLSQITSKDF